jgi:hypothetical protein
MLFIVLYILLVSIVGMFDNTLLLITTPGYYAATIFGAMPPSLPTPLIILSIYS